MTSLAPRNYVKHKSSISYLESDWGTSVMIDCGGDFLYPEHAIAPLRICAIFLGHEDVNAYHRIH